MIICGDLNINLLVNENKNFLKLNDHKGFHQIISKPARCTKSTQSLIDHIFCNKNNNISGSGVLDLSFSDHKIVFVGRKIFYDQIHFKTSL